MMQATAVEKTRVATYIRWSTDEQSDGTTLAVQLEACRLFIQSQGWVFRDDLVFVDDGWSGGTMDRPGLARLRDAVRKGEVACVVVYKLDRLSRSVLDTVKLVLDEWEGICSVRSTREPVDTTNPAGSILFYMLASYAEWERATIKERTLSGKIKRAQQGRNPGFVPPYGYRKGARPGEWAVNAEEAAIVRRIFREYIAGRGTRAIATGLNLDGIRPRKVRHFNGDWLMLLIRNPVYTGTLRYGMSTLATRAQRAQGENQRVFFDKPRYACVEGAVPAIISQEEFARAQQVLASRRATVGYRNRGPAYLLTGIARCRCGGALRGDDRRKNGHSRYYRCGNTILETREKCPCGLIPASALEAAVLARVRETLAPRNRDLLLTGWREETARAAGAVQAELQAVAAGLAQVERTRQRVADDYRAGTLPARLYAGHIEELDQEEAALRAKASSLSDQLRRLESATGGADGLEGMIRQLDAWDSLSLEERKQLLRHAVSRCVVYRQAVGRGRAGARRSNPHPVEVDLEIRTLWA